jgi:PAS domain S-box-containing protein
MSWLQRIIDRDPDDAITVPEDPEMVERPSPDIHHPSFEESSSIVSPMETDAVTAPDAHARTGKLILIVEDEAIVANDLKETLQSLGYGVTGIAKSGENALERINKLRPDLVLMDIHLATAMDGIEAAGKIHVLYDIPVIYLTAFTDKALLDRAKVTEPYGYIIKPYEERELQSTIDIAFYKHKLDQQLKKAYGELELHVAERTVELEQINLALSESERQYRNLFEGVPIGIYRTTTSGKILDINPALVSLLGYPNREMLMKVDVSEIYMDPGDRNRWQDLIEREGTVHDFKVRFRKYNGTIIWVRDTGKAIYDDNGHVLYYNGNVEDITERLRIEENLRTHQIELETQAEELRRTQFALEASLSRYLNLYEYAPLGYFTLTEEALITDVNRAGTALFWVDRNYLINQGIMRLIAPESLDEWDQFFGRVRSSVEKQCCNLVFRLEDGSSFPARLEGVRLPNASGNAVILLAINDITTIRQYEDTLRETNEYLHKLIDFANAPIIVWDPDFQITRFNHAFERLTGMTEQEVIGQPLDLMFPNKCRDTSFALFKTTLTGERLENVEIPILAFDKTIHILLFNTANILTLDAELISTIAQGMDITERKQVEKALRTSEAKYRQLVELAQEGIWAIDDNGNTSYVNPKMVMMLGYTEEEMLGAHLFSYMDDAGKAIAADKMECRRQGITEEHEFEFITKGGNRIYASLATASITDEKGVYKGALAVVSDITEQKAAEEALIASEKRYRDVVEDQTELICRFLPDGRLTFVNEAYCNYFRLNRKEIIGKQHSVILPSDDARLMKKHLAALTPENPVAWISHRIVKPSGEMCWHRWSDRAIYDENDEVIEYQSVGRDISLIIETEIQLENYKETLEQRVRDRTSELSRTNLKLKKEIEDRKIIQKKLTLSSNEKDLLLREVHHRVKNNLQLIIGLIDMTKTRAHEPTVISILTDIMVKIQTMGSIHTRLYESKRFDKINMKRQVHDLVEMISGFHDHDHLDITTNIDCAEIYLPVDQAIPCALALNEVISNIHKHAFSGRRNGLVDISSVKKADRIRFIISDNGVGLPSGFNIEKSNRLGLKLMRTLVEQQLHGKVQITSKAGTEVVIEFPITKGEPDYGAGTGS